MFYGNLSNVYVAIVTLATALVLFAIVNSTSGAGYRIGDAVLGGYNGMTRIPRITYRLPGGEATQLTRVQFFTVCVGVALVLALALRHAGRRPFGRIDHGGGMTTLYGHMDGFAVSAGQTVSIGQVLGYVGNSGFSQGPHLHFEVRIGGAPVNPRKYLP